MHELQINKFKKEITHSLNYELICVTQLKRRKSCKTVRDRPVTDALWLANGIPKSGTARIKRECKVLTVVIYQREIVIELWIVIDDRYLLECCKSETYKLEDKKCYHRFR